MKIAYFLFFLFMVFSSCKKAAHEESDRIKTNINRAWKFSFSNQEDDFSRIDTINGNWERIGLPHSFSLPYFRSESFYEGYGWYQKELHIDENWLNKNIFLEFDGVFQVAEIFLNGEKVGEHKGGYTGFTIDISKEVKAGENLLAVRVNNLWDAQLAPRAGEHVFSGGIYRDVYLNVTNPLHVVWNGTFVTTPNVSKETSSVNIKTEIKNNNEIEEDFTLKSVLIDPKGKRVNEINTAYKIEAGATITYEQNINEIINPSLWSPDTPNLYKVRTLIYKNDSVIDHHETSFGFRWMEWTGDKGFFLNGKHVYLEGVNVHQDHAGWGDAITKAGVYRDLKLMKDAGFNLIRGSHYPHHPYFTEVCNELGLMFIPENAVWGIGGHTVDGYWNSSAYPIHDKDKQAYEESASKMLEELIHINRNSPSVIAWSMSNEPFFSANEVVDDMKGFLKNLVAQSHELDSSRMAMIGGAQRKGVDVLGDIAGYNGDGATLYRDPGFPNMVSEYGSCVTDRPGEYTPCWSSHLKGGEKPSWRSGHAIWCGFDHGSIAGNMGEMGIVDFFRIPKRSWYWYRHYFKGIEPPEWPIEGTPKSLQLFADKTTIQGTDATDDVHINVKVIGESGKHISNSPDITLTVISGPGEFPTGRSITFKKTTRNDIQILDGHAAIEFRSYEGGTSIIEATSKGLKPTQIKITTTGSPKFIEGETVLVKDRPYVNYRLLKAIEEGEAVKISDARPTRTNSTSNSTASYANDGHKWRRWIPGLVDGSVWWELDMENFYDLDRVELSFQDSPDLQITLESSENRKDWTQVAQGNYSAEKKEMVNLAIEDNSKVRFLRVSISAKHNKAHVEVREIEVFGKTN